jgi:hypothetical protein
MKYQLVLQLSASSVEDYDTMIEIEGVLIEKLSDEHEVDGHDAGSSEMNIFILTDDPMRAFQNVKSILSSLDFWSDARVAYRDIAGSGYTILWPSDLKEFKVT